MGFERERGAAKGSAQLGFRRLDTAEEFFRQRIICLGDLLDHDIAPLGVILFFAVGNGLFDNRLALVLLIVNLVVVGDAAHEVDRALEGALFFFQAEDGIRDVAVTRVQTCALPISTTRRSWMTTCGPFARCPGKGAPWSPSVARWSASSSSTAPPRSRGISKNWCAPTRSMPSRRKRPSRGCPRTRTPRPSSI